MEIASASTAHLAEVERTGVPGRVTEVVWEFDCNLLAGTYFVNAGCSGIVYGERRFLHRIIDGLMFQVLPEPGLHMTGIVDLRLTPPGARDRGNRRPGRDPVTGASRDRRPGESSWMLRGLRKLAGRSTGDPVVPAVPGARGPRLHRNRRSEERDNLALQSSGATPRRQFPPAARKSTTGTGTTGVASSGTAACLTVRRPVPLWATSRLRMPRSTGRMVEDVYRNFPGCPGDLPDAQSGGAGLVGSAAQPEDLRHDE